MDECVPHFSCVDNVISIVTEFKSKMLFYLFFFYLRDRNTEKDCWNEREIEREPGSSFPKYLQPPRMDQAKAGRNVPGW